MPKPAKFSYEKKEPFRDASYFVVVCEGSTREPEYFRFFEGLSSRVKIYPVSSGSQSSAPKNLVPVAEEVDSKLELDRDTDKLWFVVDTDHWGGQLRDLRNYCNEKPHYQVAQSNPCFEVWLYFHLLKVLPVDIAQMTSCKAWKRHIPEIVNGGFSSDRHPVLIEIAQTNAENNYKCDGDTPALGCTQLWELAAELIPLIKKELDEIKPRFPEAKQQ